MSRKRLVILTEIIAPYRIPVFNAIAKQSDVDLHVIFLSETDLSLRQWHVYKNEIRFSYEVLPAWRRRLGRYNMLLNSGVGAALRAARPDAVLCGGYNYFAAWQAAFWCRRHSVPLLLWSESTGQDVRHGFGPVEFAKIRFCGLCRAFVAAGTTSRDYLRVLGAEEGSIFVAPDAVDNDLYSSSAEKARQCADEVRARHGLPDRYFLCVTRLVKEKGVFDLLAAYSKLDESTRSQIGLVFAGDGSARAELVQQAASIVPGTIKFCGWVHREQVPEIYALAEALVFPTHSDPWGLVVNEAMACGLPVIASSVAGCVPDLVEDSWNGFVVGPRDVDGLARAMRKLLMDSSLAREMRVHSLERIQEFSPQACAEGIVRAAMFACERSQ